MLVPELPSRPHPAHMHMPGTVDIEQMVQQVTQLQGSSKVSQDSPWQRNKLDSQQWPWQKADPAPVMQPSCQYRQ